MSESTSVISPGGVLFYPNLFVARLGHKPKPTDKPKFSTTVMFTPEAMATPEWKVMMAAVRQRGIDAWGEVAFGTMMKEGSVALPFRRDVVSKGYPDTFGCFINISSGENYPPAVLGRDAKPIVDPRAFYNGTLARVSLSTRSYGGKGTEYKPGISFDLRNVQKLGDGPVLVKNGGVAATDEFSALEPLPDAGPAAMPGSVSLESMLG